MALLGNFGDGYTRTGNDGFSRWEERFGFISRVPLLKYIAAPLTKLFGYVSAAWEGISLLVQGKPFSAATAVTAGIVGTTVDVASSLPVVGNIAWWVNPLVGVTTGRTLGTHARKLTEEIIGGVTGVVGMKPTILRSHTVGLGTIGSPMSNVPGQFVTQEAQRRGLDPRAYAASKMNGDMVDHVAQLESARSQPNYAGLGA